MKLCLDLFAFVVKFTSCRCISNEWTGGCNQVTLVPNEHSRCVLVFGVVGKNGNLLSDHYQTPRVRFFSWSRWTCLSASKSVTQYPKQRNMHTYTIDVFSLISDGGSARVRGTLVTVAGASEKCRERRDTRHNISRFCEVKILPHLFPLVNFWKERDKVLCQKSFAVPGLSTLTKCSFVLACPPATARTREGTFTLFPSQQVLTGRWKFDVEYLSCKLLIVLLCLSFC